MSYTPTNWATGDTITATKLNKLENGVANAGSALIVQYNAGTYQLDKTVQEIYDAFTSGTPVYLKWAYGTLPDNYVSHTHLVPIIKIFAYDYSNAIRIVANWAKSCTPQSGSGDYLFAPSTILFSASGLSDYPTLYRVIQINGNSLLSTTDIF